MASVFLSYSREDATKARRIARALEGAGHSVWWDIQIGTGTRFSAEIEEALRNSDLVVVLWSKAAVKSVWVQDEAAAGRDSGKLVPVLIEEVEPPLGFRQFQSLDLTRAGRSDRALKPLLEAVAQKLALGTSPAPGSTKRWPIVLPWKWAVAAFFVVLAVAAGLLLLLPGTSVGTHSVAIAAEGGDMARSADLARAVALDLGRYRAGPLGSLSILPESANGAKRAEYRVEVGVSGGGNDVRADVSLKARRNPRLLWSASIPGERGKMTDLRQDTVLALANVLTCAVDLQSGPAKFTPDVVGLYLSGCGRLADYDTDDPGEELLSTFRQITAKAPNLAQGWATLAMLETKSWPSTAPHDLPGLAVSAREHLRRAKEIDPTLPIVFAAEAYLPENLFTPDKSLAILERGLKRHPESALLHSARSYFLSRVGRINESVQEAAAAKELDPLSPAHYDTYSSALAYAGQTQRAFAELDKAEAIWPGSTVLRQARYRLDLRYGDPRNALRMLEAQGAGDARPIQMDRSWQSFLEARIDPTPAKVEKALDSFRERYRRNRSDVVAYVQALGTFGRVDEAFTALVSAEALDGLTGGPDVLFRVHMHSIRSDPRFMRLAQRLDLLSYWQTSGVWPDFCRDTELPYDCREAAAELVQRKS